MGDDIFPFARRKRRWSMLAAPAGLLIGVALAGAAIYLPVPNYLPTLPHYAPTEPARTFGLCFAGGGMNCVVDGDTAWIDGVDVRIADIDAPETHPPLCQSEADLGRRATLRMQELLDAGPFTLQPIDRDEDQYGRKLRVVMRDGRSVGMQLVDEGLARHWTGSRQPWC